MATLRLVFAPSLENACKILSTENVDIVICPQISMGDSLFYIFCTSEQSKELVDRRLGSCDFNFNLPGCRPSEKLMEPLTNVVHVFSVITHYGTQQLSEVLQVVF